jgi:hypothetical protein
MSLLGSNLSVGYHFAYWGLSEPNYSFPESLFQQSQQVMALLNERFLNIYREWLAFHAEKLGKYGSWTITQADKHSTSQTYSCQHICYCL